MNKQTKKKNKNQPPKAPKPLQKNLYAAKEHILNIALI